MIFLKKLNFIKKMKNQESKLLKMERKSILNFLMNLKQQNILLINR